MTVQVVTDLRGSVLSRGKLRKQYGDAPCDKLMATSEFMSQPFQGGQFLPEFG